MRRMCSGVFCGRESSGRGKSGVFSDFNVLTKEPLADCQCFDLIEFQNEGGLFPIFYLKLAMDRLNYDYFVWLDADTLFRSAPDGLLLPLANGPIHVPFLTGLKDCSGLETANRYEGARLPKPYFQCATAFWIVHHDVIAAVYELARNYWESVSAEGFQPNLSEVLGYVAHLLVADYRPHLQSSFPRLWSEQRESEPCQPHRSRPDGIGQSSIFHLGKGHK